MYDTCAILDQTIFNNFRIATRVRSISNLTIAVERMVFFSKNCEIIVNCILAIHSNKFFVF